VALKVAVVAEYYPRRDDPVLGVWAHRQALAARDAGVDVHVLVLHRPVPSRAALARRDPRALVAPLRQPLRGELDGLPVTYVPFLAPPRPRSYPRWGAYAAPALAIALRRLRPDLVHAHYAAPAGDAVRRVRPRLPYVVSVHGGDVLGVARDWPGGEVAVRRGLAGARLVLANSAGIERRCKSLGAERTRVVHLGTDVPNAAPRHERHRIVTVGNLVARKRHADVLRALWWLRDRLPELRWTVVGDGPERGALERLADELGLADRVEFRGALPHDEAVAAAREAAVFVLPSVDEAFGVAYVEAMAAGVPAIGARGEPGPEEIAAHGDGIRLVAPGEPGELAGALADILTDDRTRLGMAREARRTVIAHFTWEACGRATAAAYEDALGG
jgi:teichuronic acid biosynthesis glycosyltransferase TuaC